ncbi:hypothetical protein K1719_039962 [Acacia pycnantha]|nr:hypothetical protein K1719_039962 [Acacia pycnantha]
MGEKRKRGRQPKTQPSKTIAEEEYPNEVTTITNDLVSVPSAVEAAILDSSRRRPGRPKNFKHNEKSQPLVIGSPERRSTRLAEPNRDCAPMDLVTEPPFMPKWDSVVKAVPSMDAVVKDWREYLATVLAIGTECDIALLTVNDDEFWDGVSPVEFGDLPALQDAVTVVGYPIGGDTISVTSGAISRIAMPSYVHGSTELLGVQIDAAINSGSCGGPAFNGEGKCVGIAIQSLKHEDSEKIGYVIPSTHSDSDDAEEKKLEEFHKQIQEGGDRTKFRLLQENAGLVPSLRCRSRHSGFLPPSPGRPKNFKHNEKSQPLVIGSPERRMLAIGTECDIALLTVNDDEFWDGVSPVEFGDLPALQDAVTVVGYPIGGDTISVTSGAISRIAMPSYVHGSTELLGVQIDAAINSGSCGDLLSMVKENAWGLQFSLLSMKIQRK